MISFDSSGVPIPSPPRGGEIAELFSFSVSSSSSSSAGQLFPPSVLWELASGGKLTEKFAGTELKDVPAKL